jgi:microsomal dipeptidase-like Zn-dependent dipeptidase
MPFFDFHCHPGLKPQFADPANPISPWENIKATIDLSIIKNISINELFNELLNSQSSLTQLSNEVKLFGLVLHAPEPNMAVGLASQPIVSQGLVNLINIEQINFISRGQNSYGLIKTELKRLIESVSANGAKLVLLQKKNDFDEKKPSTIYGFICVEGLHCFMNDPDAADVKERFTKNFEEFTDQHTILAINICHLQQNTFCNHAHGIQVFNESLFYPIGNGITKWGIEVIERMIEKNILIDIKHTGLRSRRQLYEVLKNDDGSYRQPIICTHAGVTGLSINERVKYLLNKPINKDTVYKVEYLKPQSQHLPDTYYNCNSINLYDEDIEEILNSGGLIGLSFDQRILGFANENVLRGVNQPSDVEYISSKEATFFLGPSPETLPLYNSDEGIWTTEDFENTDPALDEQLHFRFFFNNVFHILDVARQRGVAVKKAAKQICLGTDFDGLINAIDNCKTAIDLVEFKKDSIARLPALLKEANLQNEGLDIHEFTEDLFYRNGRDFVLGRLG